MCCVFTLFQFVLSTHLRSSKFSRSQQNRTLFRFILEVLPYLTQRIIWWDCLLQLVKAHKYFRNQLNSRNVTLSKKIKFKTRKASNLHFAARTSTSCSYSPEAKGKMNMHPFLFQWDKASCTRKQELFFFICHGSGLSTYSDSVPPRSEQLPGSLAKVLTLVTKCNWSSCEKLLEILLKPV